LKKVSPKSRPPRRQPQRTCIICRQTSDKRTLVRIVRTAAAGVLVDERGKVPGRGAYLCQQNSCWQTALGGQALQHALKTSLNDVEKQQLREYAVKFAAKHPETAANE
jgi:uncharacterized protein